MSIMYDYIRETPDVLTRIIEERSGICSEFVECFKGADIETLYIIGSGTSYHAGVSAKLYIEELTGWKVIPMYPTRFAREERVFDERSLVIGVSQGGQSLSTVEGLDAAAARGLSTAALSENPTALVFEHAQTKTLLKVGNERCGAKTKGYSGSILTLLMMATELALAKGIVETAAVEGYLTRMRSVIANLSAVTDAAVDWYDRIAEDLLPARRIVVVGYDGNFGDVLEGALKTLETLRVGVEGYDIEEFFHGIYNSISEDCHLFYLASEGDYKARTLRLIEILSEWTPHNYLIGSPSGIEDSTKFDCVVPFVEDPLFSCLEYIIPMQVVACFGAEGRNVDPSIPKDPLFHQRIGSKQLDGVRDNYTVAGSE